MWIPLGLSLVLLLTDPRVPQSPESPTLGSLVLMTGRGQMPTATLVKSFAHPDPRVRAVAARIAAVFDVPAIRPTIEAVLANETDPDAGAEMIRTLLLLGGPEQFALLEPHGKRIGTEARLVMYRWLARSDAEKFVSLLPQIEAELGAEYQLLGSISLAATILKRPALLEEYRAKWRKGLSEEASKVPAADLVVAARLVPVFQRDLLSAAAAAAGCELGATPRFGYAQVSMRPDGRPEKVAVDPAEIPKPCIDILAGLARLTLADHDRPLPPDRIQWLALPFTDAYGQCAPSTAYTERARPAGKIKPPRKVKDVRPEYPPDMQQSRIQGPVLIEATLNEQGCVASARAVKSPALGLSLAALRAVSGWVFEPVEIAGKAVPTSMTITVNFTLR